MLIHDNIKYLRKLKKLSQQDFAQRLGLNRGNIASYELLTVPPLDVILKIADWYNISTDALLKVNLSESLTMNPVAIEEISTSKADMADRLKKIVTFTEKKEEDFATSIGIGVAHLLDLMNGDEPIDLEVIMNVTNAYPWISLEWFVRGQGSMVGSTQAKLNKVAEPLAAKYFTKGSVSIELFMEQVLERLEKLENKER